MNRVAALVLAGTPGDGDLGRVVNAFEMVKEFREADDEARLIFDGAGTKWIAELSKPDHRYRRHEELKPHITGACGYCASAFKVREAVEAEHIALLEEFDRHPSIRKLMDGGFQVTRF